jgi:hypothetical protein
MKTYLEHFEIVWWLMMLTETTLIPVITLLPECIGFWPTG